MALPTTIATNAHAAAVADPPAATFALLGDTPYGAEQTKDVARLVNAINADKDVSFVVHVGDIKSGGTVCSDAAFADLKASYDRFEDPFILTPGDNEWTDCHRTNNGSYVPTERLAKLREVFFPVATKSLGKRTIDLASQASDPVHKAYLENRWWKGAGNVMYATVHVVGSNNDLAPWAQLTGGDRPAEREAEYKARNAAGVAWIDGVFAKAKADNAPALFIAMQANTFESSPKGGFADTLAALTRGATAYGKPVFLAQGDDHFLISDYPIAAAPNIRRVQTFGASIDRWLKVEVRPGDKEPFRVLPMQVGAAKLVGHATLPATTFAAGPPSGSALGKVPVNGINVPFTGQPVQGFSAIAKAGDGAYWVMADNGYGNIGNSADFNLRLYKVRPSFTGAANAATPPGDGSVKVESFIELRDPDRKIPFAITNHFTNRVLTGADFDVESLQIAPDGTLWIGDEFGPFLLHFDATGKLLDAPISLPDARNPGKDLRAAQNPLNEEGVALRLMNAVTAHAKANGNTKTPVFSPWNVMLADGNPATNADSRVNGIDGLPSASSEVYDSKLLQQAGYPVVVWTVNDSARMTELLKLGVNGIISDRPDLLYAAVAAHDANGDGKAGDWLLADGRIDYTKFDAQGHRGGRNQRPENTLPALEVALDNLMTTLEFDAGVSADYVPILDHDPTIEATKCRRVSNKAVAADTSNSTRVNLLTVAEIQSTFVCDKLFRGAAQVNDRALSPATVDYATRTGLPHIYAMPTLEQVFDFVDSYVAYYTTGAGKADPKAAVRAANAKVVRFNIETKINPRSDHEYNTWGPDTFVAGRPWNPADKGGIGTIIMRRGLADRADIQSFDWRTLLITQERYPQIRTVYLFGDFPQTATSGEDGTNLQPFDGPNTPWLAGLQYPYLTTSKQNALDVRTSGGFEGLALSADGTKLYALLEQPIVGATTGQLLMSEFDLATKRYTGNRWTYQLDQPAAAIGDFVMTSATHGLVIERDNTQGNLLGTKAIFEFKLGAPGTVIAGPLNGGTTKRLVVDLMAIDDPQNVALPGKAGDIGVGDGRYAMPFVTIEDVLVLSPTRILVANDNNFPFSVGRHAGTKAPDDNEFVILDLATPLGSL